MEKNKFKALALEVEPLLKDMEAVLEKHRVTNPVSVWMDPDGYFDFTVYETGFRMIRTDHEERPIIEHRERLEND